MWMWMCSYKTYEVDFITLSRMTELQRRTINSINGLTNHDQFLGLMSGAGPLCDSALKSVQLFLLYGEWRPQEKQAACCIMVLLWRHTIAWRHRSCDHSTQHVRRLYVRDGIKSVFRLVFDIFTVEKLWLHDVVSDVMGSEWIMRVDHTA